MDDHPFDPARRSALLALDGPDFEAAVGFGHDQWRALKDALAEREARCPSRVGKTAPAIRIPRLHNDGRPGPDCVGPADFRGQWLGLVLGCHSCPAFRTHVPAINSTVAAHAPAVAFLAIYVRELHPVDGWLRRENLVDGIARRQPRSLAERAAAAADWRDACSVDMPIAVDAMNDLADSLFAGSPERLYLIDPDGVIRHRSPEGPFGEAHLVDLSRAVAAVGGCGGGSVALGQ